MVRILLVEDDLKQSQWLTLLLRGLGFTTDVAGRGDEAVQKVTSSRYDVVLLDWTLPDRDGLGVLKELRSAGLRTPVVMVTGRTSVPDRVEALQAGADDYIIKPYDISELAARVQAVLRRVGTAEGWGCLRCGRIAADMKSQEVFVDGARVSLTNLEFRLLVALLESAGTTLSRAAILSMVWGVTTDAVSNVLDVHVARLREKLGDARGQIETVRGVGYRLRAESIAECGGLDRCKTRRPTGHRS